MSVLILNGFDRCGSSAISRTLSQHPQVELIFQPFNSGSIRSKMYQILSSENASKQDYDFYDGLRSGSIDESYIKSEWYYKYSTTRTIVPRHLHIVKTTINHFTAEWHLENFPEIPLWGIWREPEAILNSILRNSFTDKWYSDALEGLKPTLSVCDALKDYLAFIPQLSDHVALTSFFIAVRSHYFFQRIPVENILRYELFATSPSQELGRVCNAFDLEMADFDAFSKHDLNVIGKAYQPKQQEVCEIRDPQLVNAIFAPLKQMMYNKFKQQPND